MSTNQVEGWEEEFDKKFCLILQTSEPCDKCGQTHLVKKNIGFLNKIAQERLNILGKKTRKSPILDDELATPEKIKSFIRKEIQEARRGIIEECYKFVKSLSRKLPPYPDNPEEFVKVFMLEKGITNTNTTNA